MEPDLTRVLIAEDDKPSSILLERNLQNWGFSVIKATDGEEALAILESDDAPNLAILDWMMPKLDGREVCLRVRKHVNRPYIYIIMLTAKSHKEAITVGLRSGADDYVIKPFEAGELEARLSVGQRMVRLERTLANKVAALETALSDVHNLKSLLPICMYCDKIRDDDSGWRSFEDYFKQQSASNFSHGVCPDCYGRQLDELDAGKPSHSAGCV